MKIMRAVMSMEDNQTQDYREINQEVGDSLIEVHEADNELEGITSDIEDAQDVGDAVSEIAEHVETAQETEGGLSEAEAETINIAVEHLCRSIGYRRKAMPSLESHYSDKKRASVALEGLGEIVSSIWEAIKAAFNKVISWISNVFKSIFGSKKKIEQKAKTVGEQSATLETAVAKKPAVAAVIEKAGTATTAAEIQSIVESNSSDTNTPAETPQKVKPHVSVLTNQTLVKFFRAPNGQDVFTGEEIQKRFETNLEGLAIVLDSTQQYSLSKLAELIDGQTKRIDEEGDGALEEGYNYFDNFMKNLGKKTLSGYDKVNNTNPELVAEPLSMAFDSSVVFYKAKNTKDEKALAAQNTVMLPWPELKKEDAVLKPAHPKLTNECAKEAYESAKRADIEKHVARIEKSLEAFKTASEKAIKGASDESKARKLSVKINHTNALVMRILSTAKLLSVYQLVMTDHVLNYARSSNQWVEQVIRINE